MTIKMDNLPITGGMANRLQKLILFLINTLTAMTTGATRKILLMLVLILIAVGSMFFFTGEQRIDYNADVKPIINKKCISCHGGVKKKGGFSLLFREEALAKTESGKIGIVPGKPEQSEMIRRLTLNDVEERMPYKEHPLPEHEINILSRWIRQGAKWGTHWSYKAVEKQALPQPQRPFFGLLPGSKPKWVRNDIDYFINEKLEEQNLKPSAEADKATLLRRVSLDVIGLPPTDKLAKQFMADPSDKAYEKLVDQLLASPAYGERWASVWMDLARYADSKGFERDPYRNMYRYRDWLIKAFNEDKPYDQFLTEQLAGDLLPNPDTTKYLATAFHRNTMTNDEGGTDNEEYRTAAVMDRVSTTWETLMGTTFACVQCHSHPYDPFKHEEYYKFLAFFNNTRDEDTYDDFPVLREYRNEDSIKFEKLKTWALENLKPEEAQKIILFIQTGQPAINSLTADSLINSAIMDTKYLAMRRKSKSRLKKVDLTDKTELIVRYSSGSDGGRWAIHLDKPDGPILKTIFPKKTDDFINEKIELPEVSGVHDLWFTYDNPSLKKDNNGIVFNWFYFTGHFPGQGISGYDEAYKHYWDLVGSENFVGTPVMVENPDEMLRVSNVFERGNWLVKGEEVSAGVPASLNPMPKGAPANRLGLAMWMVDKKNPLVSRAISNRIWEQIFGKGIVETLEDLGSQGLSPTHRELLDWMSWKLMTDYGWSLKKLIREIVMSATYRQDSRTTPELQAKDPFNKYYARGPRVRLSAEQVRDQTLAVSGMLSRKMFGKSVMPYQPDGIWLSPYSGEKWELSEGEDGRRRSLYTHWKRTAPYPAMIMFDGAAREVCSARRITTNTPLQALVTLNDSSYLVMARHFAEAMDKASPGDAAGQISWGYRDMMFKPITRERLSVLSGLYSESLERFRHSPDKACEVMGGRKEKVDAEDAARVIVANAMLNLDEWITKN